jgi:hypothetical protein
MMKKNDNSKFFANYYLNFYSLLTKFKHKMKFNNNKKDLTLFFNVNEFKTHLIIFIKAVSIILNLWKQFLYYLIMNNSSLENINKYPYFFDFKKIFFDSKISLQYGIANQKYNLFICNNFFKLKDLEVNQDFVYFFSLNEANKVLAQYKS